MGRKFIAPFSIYNNEGKTSKQARKHHKNTTRKKSEKNIEKNQNIFQKPIDKSFFICYNSGAFTEG